VGKSVMFGTDFGSVSGSSKPDTAAPAAAVLHPAVAQAATGHPAVAAALASHPAVQAIAPHVAAAATQHAAAGGFNKPALNHPAVAAAATSHPALAAVLGSHPGAPAAPRGGRPGAIRPGAPGAPRRGGPDGFGTRHYDPNAHHDTYRGYGDWVRAGRPATWGGSAWSNLWPWHWFGHDVHRRYRDRHGNWVAPPVGVGGWFRSRSWWPWHDIEVVDDPDYVSAPSEGDADGPVVTYESDDSTRAFLTDYADDPAAEAAGYAALENMDLSRANDDGEMR
jgi:hypothetical protein